MLSIPRGTDFVEARRLIDEEQRNCENRLLLLKMQRNTFTDVAKLPDEVLLEIFMILKKENEANFWYYVTHVCRHWRWVAIQAPQLWTKPPTHHHDLTLLFLDRSKPLGLDVTFSARTSGDTVIAVSKNIQRIQTLFMTNVAPTLLTRMQEFLLSLGHEATMLKVIHISPEHSRQSAFKLSASTFSRPLLLQKLSLQSIDFDWTMLPLPHLTYLSLSFMRPSDSSSPSWESLLHTLASMPLLQKIRLNMRQRPVHTPSHTINPFTLSYLTILHIAGPTEMEILAFLSTVAMPAIERIDMFCDTKDSDDYSSTIRAISRMIEKGNFGVLDELHLDEDGFQILSQSAERITFGHSGTLTENGIVRFTMELLSSISALTASVDSTVTRATLGSFPAAASPKIVEIFAGLPLLESIAIWDEMSIPFLNNLDIPASAMEDAQIPFPDLKSITFREEEYSDDDSVFCSELFDMLYDCLMRRCDYNAPIDNLLIPWIISEKEFRSLKEVAVNFNLDGCGGIEE